MLKRLGLFFSVMLLASAAFAAEPPRRLMMIGGGEWPHQAVARFLHWAGGERAHILVIAWATEDPEGSFEYAKEQFKGAQVELAVSSDTLAHSGFTRQLNRATAVWFSGGDQARHMEALKYNGGAPLEAVRKRHRAGIPMGGTSAGTAVMGKIMITGEGEAVEGLGLLDGVIMDQHFIRRSRQNRLFDLVLKHPELLGLGVDEHTALAVDGDRAEVLGTGMVMAVHASSGGFEELKLECLHPGQAYDLKSRTSITLHAD